MEAKLPGKAEMHADAPATVEYVPPGHCKEAVAPLLTDTPFLLA